MGITITFTTQALTYCSDIARSYNMLGSSVNNALRSCVLSNQNHQLHLSQFLSPKNVEAPKTTFKI